MDESRDPGLVKVDEEKRSFLKKLALGTAYAVPVIATFSLDGVRSKARAQAVYSDPVVLSLRAVPAIAALPDYMYGEPPSPFVSSNPYSWVITFDRPMDPAFASAKICYVERFESNFYCDAPPITDPTPTDSCGDCGLPWEWSADRTQLRAAADLEGGTWTRAQRLTIWLNHPSCAADILFRDTHGNRLPPFVGVADLCGGAPPVPG
jgi:hypothetical protein